MKKTIILTLTAFLASCASPAQQMSPQQISMLSSGQLCDLHNNYAWDQNTEIEIGRRNLICDPAINECMGRGNKLGTPAMALCVDQLRQNWALQKQVQRQDAELKQKDTQLQNQQMWDNILEKSGNQKPKYVKKANGTIIQY